MDISTNQIYYLIFFYALLNLFTTINLLKKGIRTPLKAFLLFFLWSIPFVGYFTITLFFLMKDQTNLEKINNIGKIIAVSAVYIIFFLLLG